MRLSHIDQRTTSASAAGTSAPSGACPDCGWPDAADHEIVSRHHTSEGLVTWARCICGTLQAWMEPAGGPEPVARARTVPQPDSPTPEGDGRRPTE
jgi:hypothetical protein